MADLRSYALIGTLIEEMKAQGSWCGETHIQKAAFVAQSVFSLPLEAEFVLYKHGPFSFDLGATLTAMRADGVLDLVPQGSYGPSYAPSSRMNKIIESYYQDVEQYIESVRKVAQFLGRKNVSELEKIATAIYIRKLHHGWNQEQRSDEIHRIKPHISLKDAFNATLEADRFIGANAT